MSGGVEITLDEAHEIADLLDWGVYDSGIEQDRSNVLRELLREQAGLREPTSYAARARLKGSFFEEWARESNSNAWWCLSTTRPEKDGSAHLWYNLVARAKELDAELEVVDL